MSWNVEYTDEFGSWWGSLSEEEQVSLDASVRLLEERGPNLGFPHSSGINNTKHGHMREYAHSMMDGHCVLCMRLIHGELLFCLLVVIKRAVIAGMTPISLLPSDCMTNILNN